MSPSIEGEQLPIRSLDLPVPNFVIRLSDDVPFDPVKFDKLAEALDRNERIQLRFLVVSDTMYCYPNLPRSDVRFNAFSAHNVYRALQDKGNLQSAGRILVNSKSHNRYMTFEFETEAMNKSESGDFAKMFGNFFTLV